MVVALPTLHKVRFYRSRTCANGSLPASLAPPAQSPAFGSALTSSSFPCATAMETSTPPAGCSASTSIPAHPPAAQPISTSSANSTARASLTTIPAPARTGPIGARTSTPPHPSPTSRPITIRIWIAWMGNWQYACQAPLAARPWRDDPGPQPLSARAARPSRSHPRPGAAATGPAPHSPHPRLQTLCRHVRRPDVSIHRRGQCAPRQSQAPGQRLRAPLRPRPRRSRPGRHPAPPQLQQPQRARRTKKPSSASTRKKARSFSIAPTPAKPTGPPISPPA